MAEELCSADNHSSLLSPLLINLLFLCSFLLHHPLTLAYFFLLSPYLLNLFFFLYPLLFSTSLLFLALLTVSPHLHDSPPTSDELPVSLSGAVLNILRAELIPDDAKASLTEQLCSMVLVAGDHAMEERQENTREDLCSESRHESEESITKAILPCRKEHSRRPSEILQRDGSARKEKEWKRTLGCKLFEERMTDKLIEDRDAIAGEAEEMDLLWEAYDVAAHKHEKQRRKQKHEKEDDGGDEEGLSGHLCCLKALRISAGKMKLRVGKPSLEKISMALNGIPLFNSAGRRRSRREWQ